MSQASACIPPRARVVTFRRAANDNRRPVYDPRWSSMLRRMYAVAPEFADALNRERLRGKGFDETCAAIIRMWEAA